MDELKELLNKIDKKSDIISPEEYYSKYNTYGSYYFHNIFYTNSETSIQNFLTWGDVSNNSEEQFRS